MSAAAAASRHRWLAVAAGRAAMPDVAKQDFKVAMWRCQFGGGEGLLPSSRGDVAFCS